MLLHDAVNDINYRGNNWAYQVKTLLDSLGLSYIWENQELLSNIPYHSIKQRILDTANQNLIASINSSNKLLSYCSFKENTEYEKYLDVIKTNKFKYALSRFRLSSHSLAVETGRYYDIPREERLCKLCSMQQVETEFHFLLVCPFYTDIRRKYLSSYYCKWPTLTKFKSLMKGKNTRTVIGLSKYIYFANDRRKAALY